MTSVSVTWADTNLKRYGKRIGELNQKFPKVLPRIVNQVGNRAKTQVIRQLTKQTGLQRRVIVAAIGDPGTARPGKLTYEMFTRGGFIRLKYLSAREKRGGVTAKPFGQTRFYEGAFMRGGAFPNRKPVARFDGHAYRRLNRSGSKITQVRSEVRIPTEMTRGATRSAFLRIAGPLLDERISAALRKLLP